MNKHFRLFAFIVVALEAAHCAILVNNQPSMNSKVPKDRKLIFTWDRDEEFKRREDRERCRLKSQRRNDPDVK